jgi:hypothetical protein
VSDAQGVGDRGLASRGLPNYDPPPAPLVRSPVLQDRWFRTARKLYLQGIQSTYVPGMLKQYGGVLSLASQDAEQIRTSSMIDGWIFDSRDPGKEQAAASARWAAHENAMRSAIAAGAPPETAIRSYFDRTADTEPEDLDTLKYMTTTQAPSYLWGWQTELEATKARFSRLVNAPHDMPIGYTVAAVAALPDLPETPGEVDHVLDVGQAVENFAGPLADVYGVRSGGQHASGLPRAASDPVFPTAPSSPSTRTVQEPLRARGTVGPEVFDVRAPGAGAWKGVADDEARGLASPPHPAASGALADVPTMPRDLSVGGGPGPGLGGEVRFVGGAPVFEQPMLGVIYADGPTVASLRPPWDTKYKYSKAGNLLALWEGRYRRVDGMSRGARSRYGYNIPSDAGFKEALYDHWEERGLARQNVTDGSWEMLDIVLQKWFPESEIDKGHVMACVEHHRMMVERLGDDATRTADAERQRRQYVRTFMRDPTNYVPQLKARNRGADSLWTYEGDHPDFRLGGQDTTVLPGGERLRTPTPTE